MKLRKLSLANLYDIICKWSNVSYLLQINTTTWTVNTQAVFRKLSLDQSSAFDWLKQFDLLEKLRFSQNMYCKHVMMNILFVKGQIFKETFVFRKSETNIWSAEIN